MTVDRIQEAWHSQLIPSRTPESLGEIIARKNAAAKRQLITSFVITGAAVALSIFNFCGQYFWNGNTLLVSSLRALPVLAATVINIFVCRRMAKEQRERRELAATHEAWLRRWVGNLETEVRGAVLWKFAAFFSFAIAVIAVTKWLDYRSGEDSAGECIGIVVAAMAMCLLVSIAYWHYRTQFLIPELQRCRQMLNELEDQS